MKKHLHLAHAVVMVAVGLWVGQQAVVASAAHGDAKSSKAPSEGHQPSTDARAGDKVISESTENHLAANRLVFGRIHSIRSGQMEIDIGNPQLLYVPLQPAHDKGQRFKAGDPIVVTMNDHNAVVDYHPPGEQSDHRIIRGHLTTPLTVGLDKAVIETEKGTTSLMVADRAKGKLSAIPVGVEALFLADETGELVDAQLASADAVQQSGQNNKARIKGAHEQVRARYQGAGQQGHIKIETGGEGIREVPFRPPLPKMEDLKPGQDVVLLMDDDGYVLEIASPEVPAR
jgi:hypothetical protein